MEHYPLTWPQGWPRTRPQDRKPMAGWKRTANQYREDLSKELKRMGAPSFVITSNVQVSQRGNMVPGVEPLDVGVAVYFSMPIKEDFSWQDALGIHDPAPTEEQVQAAFKRLAAQYHPDRPGGDIEMFKAATKHRDNALRWIARKSGVVFDKVIPADQFKEVRLNLASIVFSIRAIRQLERCGNPALLDRAFAGFTAIAENAGQGQP